MAYLYNYNVGLTATADDNVIATNNIYSINSQVADLTSTNVLLVSANTEVEVQLPGLSSIVALNISSDNLFDVALVKDLEDTPIYSGVFGNSYARFMSNGSDQFTLFIKASTTDAVIKLSVVGL